MKSRKTLLGFTLAASLVVTAGLSGCGQQTNNSSSGAASKAPVTIAWWYRGNGVQADTKKVNDKVNEMLKSYTGLENVTLELHPFTATDYATQVTLGQSAGEQIDILNTVGLSFPDQVKNGTYITLDKYLPELKELKEELPSWLLDLGKLDGKTYMIPHYQQAANMPYITFPKVYVDKYADLAKLKSVLQDEKATIDQKCAVLEDYVKAVQKGEGKTKYGDQIGNYVDQFAFLTGYFDAVGSSNNAFRVMDGTKKVVYWPLESTAKEGYAIAANWYQEGLLPPDPTTKMDNLTKANMLKSVSTAFCFDQGIGSADYVTQKLTKLYGFDVVTIPLKTDYFIGQTWGAGGDGVTASSKHPEEAVKFLQAMDTKRGKDIYNTIVYGLEGVHYTKIDATHIKTLGYDGPQGGSDYLYSAHKWIMGNTFNAYLNQGTSDEEIAAAKEINTSGKAKVSALSGMVFDSTPVSTEFSQVVAVNKEYTTALAWGSKGKDEAAYYNEYVTKVKAAQVDKVLSTFQKQVDNFFAKKK